MRNDSLHTRAAVIIGNTLYCSNNNMNGLFSINLDDMKIDFLGFFPKERTDVDSLHRSALILGDWIVFAPEKGSNISLYNYKEKTFKSIVISESINSYNLYKAKDSIWFFPFELNKKILRLDINFSIYEIDYCGDYVSGELIRGIFADDKIISVVYGTDILLIYDLNDRKGTTYSTGFGKLNAICNGRNGFWILPVSKMEIYEIGHDYRFLRKIKYGMPSKETRYAENIIDYSAFLWIIIDSSYDFIIKYDCESENVDAIIIPNDIKFISSNRIKFSPIIQYDDTNYVLPITSNYLVTIKNEKYMFKRLNNINDIDAELNKKYIDIVLSKAIFEEDTDITFNEFLELIDKEDLN